MKRIVALALLVSLSGLVAGCATTAGPGRGRTPALIPALWPVADAGSRVSSRFGLRGDGPKTRHHNGIDIAAPKGSTVVATADGIVTFSGRSGSYGRAIMLAHGDGIETCYAHLRKARVKKGKQVVQGQPIGNVGHSGRADGNHLHYEVRVYGTPVDPARFLPAGPAPKEKETTKSGA